MKYWAMNISVWALAVSAWGHEAPIHEHTQLIPIPAYSLPYGQASAAASLRAARAFLASVSEQQRRTFLFSLKASERKKWSNLPAGLARRAGISVAELSDKQRTLLFEFLASSLGPEGYQSVMNVMAAEAFLSMDRRAARLQWAPENYWLSFYGTPSNTEPWGWQFGGHHLGLNLSMENNAVQTMSPSFVGTEPAIFRLHGVPYESVIDMHRAAYAVFAALNQTQQAMANAGKIPEEVLTGPGQDGIIPPVIGLSASKLNQRQRSLLLRAIGKWVSIQPEENAHRRMVQLEEELDQISFAYTGSDRVNTATYMRIQGPTLIIELLSTGGNVGQSAKGQGHYHTIYRNPTQEYGG